MKVLFRASHNSALIMLFVLLTVGWYAVVRQSQSLTEATTTAYQQTQLEITRALARHAEQYMTDQITDHGASIPQVEQDVFRYFITPVRLLDQGDAWIYAPDHVVFDPSSDFPTEYRGKSMAEIFALQKAMGASHYEAMTDAVMNAREGVGWYIWLPDKGREVAAWSPVRVGPHVWTIGVSTPLPEILESTGAVTQIRVSIVLMLLATILAVGSMADSVRSIMRQARAEQALREALGTLEEYKGHLEEQVAARTSDLVATNTQLQHEIMHHELAEQALQHSNDQLAAMYEIAHLISSQLELDTVLDSIARSTARLLNAATGVILLLDEHEQVLTIRGAFGLSEYVVANTRDRPGESIAGRVIVSGMPLVINDLANDPRFSNPAAAAEGLLACASVPLRVGNQIIGTLDVHSKRPERTFDGEDVELLQMLASHAAIAIQNARLYTAAQQEIAERKRTEEALIQAKEMAEIASRAKSQFLANMSHELRTPLTAILGYSELINLQLYESGHDQVLLDIQRITTAGKHLLALIDDLLDLAKIETGSITLAPESFEVALFIGDLVETMRPLAARSCNTLEAECAEGLGTMYADQLRVRQVLFNLISNAAKFTDHGAITIRASRYCGNGTGVPQIVFEVSDTGIGIPPPQIDQIFEAFSQVDASMTRKYGGAGLGLAISRHICKLLGGSISVTSHPGRGSTFSVVLPAV